MAGRYIVVLTISQVLDTSEVLYTLTCQPQHVQVDPGGHHVRQAATEDDDAAAAKPAIGIRRRLRQEGMPLLLRALHAVSARTACQFNKVGWPSRHARHPVFAADFQLVKVSTHHALGSPSLAKTDHS